ncbi:MAG TPA: transporter [Elusimicrobiota bacterium]|nr:transporter [Elusimicrobiota bacterium]
MKKSWLSMALLALVATTVRAGELLVTEPVSMGEAKSVSVELRPTYRMDLWKIKNAVPACEVTNSFLRTDINARWVPVEKWEVLLEVPYVSDKVETDPSDPTDDTDSGLGQVILGGKYAFCSMLGAALRVELPTADSDKYLGEGLNTGLSLLLEKPMGAVTLYANAGYLFKWNYKTTLDVKNGVEYQVDPGDIVQGNLGITHERWGMNWIGEVNVNVVGREQNDGNTARLMKDVEASAGTAVDLVLGVSKKLNDKLGVKGGVAWGVGEEKFRSLDAVRGAGDYKIILAGDYRFGY